MLEDQLDMELRPLVASLPIRPPVSIVRQKEALPRCLPAGRREPNPNPDVGGEVVHHDDVSER